MDVDLWAAETVLVFTDRDDSAAFRCHVLAFK